MRIMWRKRRGKRGEKDKCGGEMKDCIARWQ
jgi:hypothetical protein